MSLTERVTAVTTETRKTAGLTLIEMLIIIGILGILLAIAAPNLTGYVQQLRFNEGVRTFSESLLQARDSATRSSIGVRFVASGDTVRWYDEVSAVQLGSALLPNGTVVEAPTTVELSGRGLPIGQTEFQLSDANHSGSVWLLPTGAILR